MVQKIIALSFYLWVQNDFGMSNNFGQVPIRFGWVQIILDRSRL